MNMAADAQGTAEVPYISAPGLMNKGFATYAGRADQRPNSPYLCRITAAGRDVLASAAVGDNPGLRRQIDRAAERNLSRVERYLQRAMDAERKAAAIGSDEFRKEMLDVAMQWRDLARQAAHLR